MPTNDMGIRIYIDDIRTPPPGWTVVRNSRVAHIMISGAHKQGLVIEEMSLDHDLGNDDTTRCIVMYMAEHDYWPKIIYVHSMNSVGREWLEGTVQRYAPPGTLKRW